jgi:hypothetical protein
MKITAKPGERLTIDDVLAFAEQVRADAARKLMSDLLLRADADIDDWDAALATIDAYNQSTIGWRDELRRALEAALKAPERW